MLLSFHHVLSIFHRGLLVFAAFVFLYAGWMANKDAASIRADYVVPPSGVYVDKTWGEQHLETIHKFGIVGICYGLSLVSLAFACKPLPAAASASHKIRGD